LSVHAPSPKENTALRPAGRVHAAVEHRVRIPAAQLGQNRFPVGGLVGALFARQYLDARGLERLLDLVGDALAVRGRVVDHRHQLGLVVAREIAGNRRPLLVVAADDAELRLVPGLGELRIGRRARNHGYARLAVDVRGGNRCAGVEVPHYARDFRVDQLLRHGGSDLRVGLVVFGDQRELDRVAADLRASRVRLLDGEARAVLVVLAEVRDAARERRDVADLHFLGGGSRRRLRRIALGGRFLVAAADQRDGGSNESDADFVVHGISREVASGGAYDTPGIAEITSGKGSTSPAP
jgi:hypothetical protein